MQWVPIFIPGVKQRSNLTAYTDSQSLQCRFYNPFNNTMCFLKREEGEIESNRDAGEGAVCGYNVNNTMN